MHIRTQSAVIWHSGSEIWTEPVRSWNPQNRQKVDFWPKVGFLTILAIPGSDLGSGQNLGLAPILAQTCQTCQFGRSEPDGCPDQSEPGWQTCAKLAGLAGSARKSIFWLRTCQTWLQVPIYRPLSIATSVENDWGRGGPFWRSRLTLPLETIKFWKKSANPKISRLTGKKDIFGPLPSKNLEKVRFFGLRELLCAAVCDRRSPRHTALFFDFFGGSKKSDFFGFFRIFRNLKKVDFLASGQLSGQTCQTCQNRDFGHLAGSEPETYGPSQTCQTCQNLDFWPKVGFLALLRIFRIFQDFATFSGFVRISGFSQLCGLFQKPVKKYDSGQLKTWRLRSPNLNFLDTSFDMWHVSWDHLCGLAICAIFLSFLCAKKLEKYIFFGLNHLGNCWLVYAVGSLRPDTYPYVRCTW